MNGNSQPRNIERFFNTENPHFNRNAYFWHLELRETNIFPDINVAFSILSEYLHFKENWSKPLTIIANIHDLIEHYDLNKSQKLFIFKKLLGLIANEEFETKEMLSLVNIEILDAINKIEPLQIDTECYDIVEIVKESKQYHDLHEQIKFLKSRKLKYELEADELGWDIGLGKEIDLEIEMLVNQFASKLPKEKTIQTLTFDLVTACSQLQGLYKTIDSKEDSRNSFIANTLCNFGYLAKDQSKWGSSESGINPGEIDIKIEDPYRRTLSICEGMNLKNCNRSYIRMHIEKIFNYDPNGLSKNHILVYSNANDFILLWRKYIEHIKKINYEYKLVDIQELKDSYASFSDIKVAIGKHRRYDSDIELVHIFINMNFK